jgi:SAM-dependent methyltransferase
VTLLAEDPRLWDTVFRESPERARFIRRAVRSAGPRLLDVGCATGSLCRLLRQSGIEGVGIDINSRFIATARSKDPAGEYFVGNMRTFRLGRKFDLIMCLGTTFSYNLTNKEIRASLQNFRAHLRRDGCLVIDVLNAIAFLGPRAFKRTTRHAFKHDGVDTTATIRHRLSLKNQLMSEQVTWKTFGRRPRRDPPEELRLFFPQELAFQLEAAGFADISLMDGYRNASAPFTGRRLIAVARRDG